MIEIILVLLLYLALCDAVMLCLLLHASRAADRRMEELERQREEADRDAEAQ